VDVVRDEVAEQRQHHGLDLDVLLQQVRQAQRAAEERLRAFLARCRCRLVQPVDLRGSTRSSTCQSDASATTVPSARARAVRGSMGYGCTPARVISSHDAQLFAPAP
jgi:hypothetical protein